MGFRNRGEDLEEVVIFGRVGGAVGSGVAGWAAVEEGGGKQRESVDKGDQVNLDAV